MEEPRNSRTDFLNVANMIEKEAMTQSELPYSRTTVKHEPTGITPYKEITEDVRL